jgi:hypothetical protein
MLLLVLCGAAVAAGCGEKLQSAGGNAAKKSDAKSWQAADNGFVASGWKSGDRASWEEQMRQRAQSQNEYTRVTTK